MYTNVGIHTNVVPYSINAASIPTLGMVAHPIWKGFAMAKIFRRLAARLRYKQMTARLNGVHTRRPVLSARAAERLFEQRLVDSGIIAEHERVA